MKITSLLMQTIRCAVIGFTLPGLLIATASQPPAMTTARACQMENLAPDALNE